MIRFATILLLSTTALAQHYGSGVPMDFNDDIYNRDMRIQPSSNLFYNFQQARIDQPPQVEVREENLGKYMGRPRPTTPVMPRLHEQHIPALKPSHLHRLADLDEVTTMAPYVPLGPYNAHLPPTMPPPPEMPKWMDLSDDSFKNHAHYKQSRNGATPAKTYQPPSTTAAPAPQPAQWSQPDSAPLLYADSMYAKQPVDMSYNPLAQYYPSTTADVMKSDSYSYPQEPAMGGRGRGSHKFNWNDLALSTDPAQPVTSAIHAAAPPTGPKPRHPASIPTLTPWSGDSFGK